jgi:uncharacterized membrane protein
LKKKNIISEYLSDEALEKVVRTIGEIEKRTSGEMRVCIKKKSGYFEKRKHPREIALKEFVKLKMHKTIDRTGVLFFILFNEHKFEIIADEGINNKISSEQWDEISQIIKDQFTKENYLEGLLFGIERIGEVLVKEFPVKFDDKNELSDDVVIG